MQTSDNYYKPMKKIVKLLKSIDSRLENIENELKEPETSIEDDITSDNIPEDWLGTKISESDSKMLGKLKLDGVI